MESDRYYTTVIIGLVLIALIIVPGCLGPSKPPSNKSSGSNPPKTYGTAITTIPTTFAENWYDESNKWSPITVLQGSTTKIQLKEDPQIGMWRVDLTDGLRIANEGYVPYNSTNSNEQPGGVHIWYVQAISKGPQNFSAIYIYNGDKPAGEKKVFELGFNVV